MNLKSKKLLVIGGAGFIGSNLTQALVKDGCFVRVLDNFSTGKKENLNNMNGELEIVEGDIRNFETVQKAVEGIDIVFLLAALPSVQRSIKDPITSNEVNVSGLLNVLWACKEKGIRKIVYSSSSSVYGDSPGLPRTEDMAPRPISPYAVSKLAAEQYLTVFSKIYGMQTVALRYFNVFGPKQDPNSFYSAVIPKFIQSILKNETPIIFGDGEQSRDFTYVDNVVLGNMLAASMETEPGVIFNCACHGQISLNRLIKEINAVLGKNVKAEYQPHRLGDIKDSFASIEKIEKAIGFVPVCSFEEGLKKTIDWYTKHNS